MPKAVEMLNGEIKRFSSGAFSWSFLNISIPNWLLERASSHTSWLSWQENSTLGPSSIHPRRKNRTRTKKKLEFFKSNGCKLLDSFVMNQEVWWNKYYKCLEEEISKLSDEDILSMFKSDLLEIDAYKKDSSDFKSVYYVIKNLR